MTKKERLKKAIRELFKKKKQTSEDLALLSWQRKRKEFQERCLKGYEPVTGEALNMLEGLTPDGYDRNGKKIGFIETGSSIFARPEILKLSEESKKISD